MPVSVRVVVYEYAKDMKHLFGTDLSKVFIYGSYARGDYTENSDVDVMVLVKTPEKEKNKKKLITKIKIPPADHYDPAGGKDYRG